MDAYSDKDYRQASVFFKKAAEAAKSDKEKKRTLLWLGKSEYLAGDLSSAEKTLRASLLVKDSDGTDEIYYYLGRTLIDGSDASEGLGILNGVAGNKRSTYAVHSLFYMAEYYFHQGDYAQAERFYSQIRVEYPATCQGESSGYRLTIMELILQQDHLLSLLSWSHEQLLLSEKTYRDREEDYLERLELYRRQLESVSRRGSGFYNTDTLLSFKARALILKRFYLEEYRKSLMGDYK
jgi:tetratricopeptide (TPR) repeat protein